MWYLQTTSEWKLFYVIFFFPFSIHTRIWNFQTFAEQITAASNFTFKRNVMWVIRMTQNRSVGKLWGIKVCLTDVWLCSSNTITSHLLCFRSEWDSPLAQLSYLNRKTVRLLLHFTLVAKLNRSQEYIVLSQVVCHVFAGLVRAFNRHSSFRWFWVCLWKLPRHVRGLGRWGYTDWGAQFLSFQSTDTTGARTSRKIQLHRVSICCFPVIDVQWSMLVACSLATEDFESWFFQHLNAHFIC